MTDRNFSPMTVSVTVAIRCGHTVEVSPASSTFDFPSEAECGQGCAVTGLVTEEDLGAWALTEEGDLVSLLTAPEKVQKVIDLIEGHGNVVEVIVKDSDDYGFDWRTWIIRWESVQTHFALRSHGQILFRTDNRTGRTKNLGGYLSTITQDVEIVTYRDIDIVVGVYTPSTDEEIQARREAK